MAADASCHRTVLIRVCIGVAMAFEAKRMKPRLDAQLQIGAAAAMTIDAGVHASPVRKIVVTCQAIDGDVLGVRKIERLAFGARKQGFAQRRSCSAADESGEAHRKDGGNAKDEARIAAENELA